MARKPEKIVSIAPFYQSKTPSRNCVFQHPALVKLGEEICKDYETSLTEAMADVVLRQRMTMELEITAHKAAMYDLLNAQIDAEIEAKLAVEAANEPVVPAPVSAYEASFGTSIMAA